METGRVGIMNLCIIGLYLCVAAISFTHCDARRSMQLFKGPTHRTSSIIKRTKKMKALKRFGIDTPLPLDSSSNTQPYGVSSPFSLPPYDSLAPIPLPENTPPFCVYPPFTPLPPPSTTIPAPTGGGGYTPPSSLTPTFPIQSPPPTSVGTVPAPPEYIPTPNPPQIVPSPPTNVPSPPEYVPSPPLYVPSPPFNEPSPPSYVPIPPSYVPSPTGHVPSPPVFQPPVVYPPPTGPPPPYKGPSITLWCVAKPSVPEPIIQEAMSYACGSGADCDSIQPNGSCFQPNTVIAHASYAFNSYWQRTKVAGGTCEFGGAAMLVSVDPSNDGCHFIYF